MATPGQKIDTRPLRCQKCAKLTGALIEKLWKTGPQGNRRYKVCMTCAKEIDLLNAPKGK